MKTDKGPTDKKHSTLASRLSKLTRHKEKVKRQTIKTSSINKSYFITLRSEPDDKKHNTLMIQLGAKLITLSTPRIIKNYKVGIYSSIIESGYDSKKRWVYSYAPRVYGIGYLPKERLFHFFFGVQSGNTRGFPADKMTLWVPPSFKYKLTKHQILGKHEIVFWVNGDLENANRRKRLAVNVLGNICPKTRFTGTNIDGKKTIGSAYIEEKEWKRSIQLFGGSIFTFKTISQRTLHLHLQVMSLDVSGKPTSDVATITLHENETTIEGITRFCRSGLPGYGGKGYIADLEFVD